MLLTAVCTAIMAVQIYAKRAVAGRLKSAGDAYGSAFQIVGSGRSSAVTDQQHRMEEGRSDAAGALFSPTYSNTSATYSGSSRSRTTQYANGATNTVLLDTAVTKLEGSATDDFSNKRWSSELVFE